MTDSHTHLTYSPLKDNLELELKKFIKNGGKKILNVAGALNDIPEVIKYKFKYNKFYPGLIKAAIGIHPEEFLNIDMKQAHKQIKRFEQLINENRESIDAIGETGLDYHAIPVEHKECKEIQKIAFRRHLQQAKRNSLPLTIHCRENRGETECVQDTINCIIEIGEGTLRGSFHSYTGSIKYIDKILDLGMYIGFNAIITYKSGGNVRNLVKKTPLNRILLETDGPWLPIRSDQTPKYGTPANIKLIAEKIANIKNFSTEKIIKSVNENFRVLFGD